MRRAVATVGLGLVLALSAGPAWSHGSGNGHSGNQGKGPSGDGPPGHSEGPKGPEGPQAPSKGVEPCQGDQPSCWK